MTTNTLHILVADDDRAIRDSLARALPLEGYTVVTAPDGQAALDLAAVENPDIVVLDVMMPKLSGIEVCEALRAAGNQVPIIMLTALAETSDRVAGLDAGADDYLPKPFDLDELFARLRALTRRSIYATDTSATGQLETLVVADLRLDIESKRVWRADVEIDLTRTEFNLLMLLMRNKGVVLDHSTIYDEIWGYDFGPDSKNLAVYISYLRRKIEFDDHPPLIHTVRGMGYSLREP